MSGKNFELVTLRNGARAVRHLGHGEVMHPSIGPWEEANRLYVEQSRLRERLQQGPLDRPFRVLDVGLGAATNAAAVLAGAAQVTGPRRPLELYSLEVDLEPLALALEDAAGFAYLQPHREAISALLATGAHDAPGLRWRLLVGDALARLSEVPEANLVLHDPFSPKSNPALWTPDAFAAVRARCAEDATLFTYSAATPTRVSMLLGGFFVGQGWSIGTKGETTVAAVRREDLELPLGDRWVQRRERSSARGAHGVPASPELDAKLRAHPQFASPKMGTG